MFLPQLLTFLPQTYLPPPPTANFTIPNHYYAFLAASRLKRQVMEIKTQFKRLKKALYFSCNLHITPILEFWEWPKLNKIITFQLFNL